MPAISPLEIFTHSDGMRLNALQEKLADDNASADEVDELQNLASRWQAAYSLDLLNKQPNAARADSMTTAVKTQYVIRDFQDADADQLRQAFAATHLVEANRLPQRLQPIYREAMASEILANLADPRASYATPPNRLFIAVNPDAPDVIAGFCALQRIDEHSCELKNVVVLPHYQGQGIATLLLDAFDQAARETGYARAVLSTYSNLQTAIGIYRRRGWQPIPVPLTPDMIPELNPLAMAINIHD